MFKKKIPWMILFILLMVLSIWAIVSKSDSYSMDLLVDTIKNADPIWLGLACSTMFFNIFFEGKALDILISALNRSEHNEPVKSHGILYSAADIYFSAITPSASGGQPASAFFMSRDGISMAQSAVILVTNMLLYTISLAIIGVFGFISSPYVFMGFDTPAKVLIIIGSVFIIGLCVIFILILKKEQWVKKIAVTFISIGAKLHIVRRKETRLNKVEQSIEQYKNCVALINEEKKYMLWALLMNIFQRLALIGTTVFVYLAFGGSALNVNEVISIQSMVLIGVYSVPIMPGGIGIADYILINGLKMVPDVASPANLELVSRGISFYCCIILSIIIMVIGYFIQRNVMRRKELKK